MSGLGVRGMRCADGDARVEVFESLDALPADATPLFDTASQFFSSRAWWEAVLAHALPAGSRPRLLLVRLRGEAVGLFPMLFDADGGGFRALTTPYTCLYEPLLAPRVARNA